MPDSPQTRIADRSHSSWAVEMGSFRIAVTRTRETVPTTHVPPRSPSRASSRAWPFTAGALAGVGGVALLVVGASAAPRAAEPMRYMVSVPVPAAVRHVAKPVLGEAKPGRKAAPNADVATGDRFETLDEPHVARAMATGAFQQWEGADGQLRFLTAGPARFADGRACRDLALLVRLADGGSHVRSAERCTTGPVTDDVPAETDAPEDAAQE